MEMTTNHAQRTYLLVPFTTGNTTGKSSDRTMDGSISSMVSAATILAIVIVVIVTFGQLEQIDDVAHITVWCTVMSWVCIGLVSFIILSVLINRNSSTLTPRINFMNDPSTKLKIVFLWLFGLGMVLQQAMVLSINVACIRIDACYHSISIVSDLVFILFMWYQTAFLTYLRNLQFISSLKINYCLSFIVISNVCLWFNAVIRDIYGIYVTPIGNPNNMTTPSTLDDPCFWRSPLQSFLQKLVPYLIPIRMEYCLLATAFVLGMSPTIINNGFTTENGDLNIQRRQTRPLIRINDNSGRSSVMLIVAVIIAVLLYLPVFIFTSLLVFVYPHHNPIMFLIWECLVCSQAVTVLIMILMGFYIVSQYSNLEETQVSLASNEYILILSASGKTAYATFGLLSGLQCNCPNYKMVLSRNLVVLFCIFLQTILIIIAKRYKRIPNAGKGISVFIFMNLFISNISVWFNDTFVGLRGTVISEGQSKLLVSNQNWVVVEHVVFPLVIYFHFHSAMDLYGLYHRYK